MASPFHTFRKNQKVWMTGVTLMAIIAFVFLGSSSIIGTGNWGSREPAAIQTKYGNLTQSQINSLRNQRKLLHQFVDSIRDILRDNPKLGGNPNVAGAVSGILGADTDDMAIERWIYSRAAESMGV